MENPWRDIRRARSFNPAVIQGSPLCPNSDFAELGNHHTVLSTMRQLPQVTTDRKPVHSAEQTNNG